MSWNVYFTKKAAKQVAKLNKKVMEIMVLLIEDLRDYGPAPGKSWSNYSKFKGYKKDARHCHLTKGSPTYVCCWELIDTQQKIIEVYYVGSHEKAPY